MLATATDSRAVFLDRDGVLNRALLEAGVPQPPLSLDDLQVFPGVRAGLSELRRAGFRLVMVTNQPDVARGKLSQAAVDAINRYLQQQLQLDAVEVCYHDDEDRCDCRKPAAGMLVHAAERDGLNLRASYMVGDRWRDVEAGKRAGCTTLLVGDGHAEGLSQSPDATVCSLLDAIDWILERERPAAETGPQLLQRLTVSVFADGADREGMLEMAANPLIRGFTTNPTLMRKAGVQDYRAFAHDILRAIPDRPISFEVFADDFDEMERQAREIAGWGANVFVKVPVTNTAGTPSAPLIRRLSAEGVALNVTALTALTQVRDAVDSLKGGAPAYISVFAGRVADTGRDPIPLMEGALELMAAAPNTRLIWASPRELLNVFQADAIGCHAITVTNDLLNKLSLLGKDLHEYSLETVRMFFNDGQAAGYRL